MTIERIRGGVDKTVEAALVLIFGVMTLNVLWQVFTRFALRDPSSYTEELARYLLVWLGLLGGAYAVGKRLHLAIDIVPALAKGVQKQLLEIIIQSCVFAFACSVVLVGGTNLVEVTLALQQISAALQIKLGYVYLALPISGALMMFYSGTFVLESIRNIRKRPYGVV